VKLTLRIDTPIEVDYYRHGGILPFVLRQLLAAVPRGHRRLFVPASSCRTGTKGLSGALFGPDLCFRE
jgi:hypothetical protein